MEPSIFTRIINGEIPCYKVAEDEKFYAFLDINPVAKGHTLVMPKCQIDYIFDIEDDMLSEMILFAKKVAKELKNKIECKRVGVVVIGLEVPHAHIHLIPMNCENDVNFAKERVKLTEQEFKEIAAMLSV
ncbi:MAG: HIT domain-containing protein [Rikenellaceae bacterium]